MATANVRKNFTATGDIEAEMLLEQTLREIGDFLSGTRLCVFLGGSYGRGDGGVRRDRTNGLLYNDLDFFVFARKKSTRGEDMLKEIADKYGKVLNIDVDFSRIMSAGDIKNNAKRLMMQELKRGYRLICGEDMLAEFLPELPADALPFSEACRLLLNRGMGLLLAGEKIAGKSPDTDFIMRNIYKAILGAGDAVMIASGEYRWQLSGRLEYIAGSDMPELWKSLYREAVGFKYSPCREMKDDMVVFWYTAQDFFRAAMLICAGASDETGMRAGLYSHSLACGEVSWENYVKYCLKNRSLPLKNYKEFMMPAVAVLLPKIYSNLTRMPEMVTGCKLYQQWLIFN